MIRCRPVASTLGLLLLLAPGATGGEALEPTQDERRRAVTELSRVIRERYAIGERAEKVARALEQKFASKAYDSLPSAEEFARTITVDLQSWTGDKHLRFGLAPAAPPSSPAIAAEAERAAWRNAIRRNNYGLPRAEILPGNVGYLEVKRFQPPDVAGGTVVAAMGYLANADAIIVDVRNCRGGSAYMMPLFVGYFFSRPTHLFDMEFRGDAYTDHYWTLAYLPGERLAEIPMYILTSAYTFSGAEGFAYRLQVLKRATIVGERTGGGANAGGVIDIPPGFRVWMPMGRPVDSETRTNWEAVGVEPDIRTAAREALAEAHLDALKALRSKATTDAERARLDWAQEQAGARHHPVTLSGADLDKLTGAFGAARSWVEGGQLRFQIETEAPHLLAPLSPTVFASETNDPVRVEFAPGADGRVERILFTDEDGQRREFARQ